MANKQLKVKRRPKAAATKPQPMEPKPPPAWPGLSSTTRTGEKPTKG